MKRIGILFLILCISICPCVAFGAGGMSIHAEFNVSDFCVDILAVDAQPYSMFAVMAVPEGEMPAESMISGTAVFYDQLIADDSGKISAKLRLDPKALSGYYDICLIDSSDSSLHRSNRVLYTNATGITTVLEAINQATAETMQTVIEANANVILLDVSEYDNMTDGQKSNVTKYFFKERSANGFSDINEIYDRFGACVAAVGVTGSESALELAEKYAQNLGISADVTKSLSKDERAEISDLLSDRSFSSPDELGSDFEELVFAGRVNAASTAGALQRYFLDTYADGLGLNLSAYNKLSNPNKVFSELLGSDINGYDDARELFDKAVRELSSGSSSTGSKGSGGRVGSGGSVPLLPVQNENTESVNSGYIDISSVEWARESIELLSAKGILAGDGNGRFRPNDNITRAEFVKIITLALGISPENYEGSFSDVSESDWFAPYVSAGLKNKIATGYNSELFGSYDNITREDMAVMCIRGAKALGISLGEYAEVEISDEEYISDYALASVRSLYGSGIVTGDESGAFMPGAYATRAQAAKIVAGLLKYTEV